MINTRTAAAAAAAAVDTIIVLTIWVEIYDRSHVEVIPCHMLNNAAKSATAGTVVHYVYPQDKRESERRPYTVNLYKKKKKKLPQVLWREMPALLTPSTQRSSKLPES